MREIQGDLWKYVEELEVPACAITTNGSYSKAKATMGAGIAREARDRYPIVELQLAQFLAANKGYWKEHTDEYEGDIWVDEPWNIPYPMMKEPFYMFSFPTKRSFLTVNRDKSNVGEYYRHACHYGNTIVGWKGVSDLTLIERSARLLVDLVDTAKVSMLVMPRPGCGRGNLSWLRAVKPILKKYFDDRFVIVDKRP